MEISKHISPVSQGRPHAGIDSGAGFYPIFLGGVAMLQGSAVNKRISLSDAEIGEKDSFRSGTSYEIHLTDVYF